MQQFSTARHVIRMIGMGVIPDSSAQMVLPDRKIRNRLRAVAGYATADTQSP